MKYFEKIAFKYNKPGHIRETRLLSDKDMVSASLRQPEIKNYILGQKTLRDKKSAIDRYRMALGGNLRGTFYDTPKGKKVAISKSVWNTLNKKQKLNLYNHEKFHAKVPILGNSETSAHLYGAIKSKTNLKEQMKHLILSNPAGFAKDVTKVTLGSLIGVGALGIKYLLKKG